VNRAGKTADGKTASIPPYEKFLDAAFAADEKSETQLLPIKGGGYFVVRVESLTPEHLRPLAEVKPAVVAGLEKQDRAVALGTLANDIAEKFKTTEGRAAAIKQYGLSGNSSGNIKRDDSMSALPPLLVEDIFARGVGQSTSAFTTKNGDYVIAVVNSMIPASAPDKEAIRQMRSSMSRDQKSEIAEEYFIYLENKFPVDINTAALTAMTAQP
ncbi:MAG: peptidyl-prolyl cis-trans isomerase, partial [Alphaproteobacteria bacterium]|nr:peptidyl-prolyl cis-trans isomerase [Alphaproteobacteria bacterium]